MIAMSGHVSAPAVAALATSTPSRSPRSFVFHVDAVLVLAGAAGATVCLGVEGVIGRSMVAMAEEVSCARTSRVMLMRGM